MNPFGHSPAGPASTLGTGSACTVMPHCRAQYGHDVATDTAQPPAGAVAVSGAAATRRPARPGTGSRRR